MFAVDLSKLAKKKIRKQKHTSQIGQKKKKVETICDDGDLSKFEKRIATSSWVRDEESFKFDSGLKVPMNLWNKLYKYQKTGVKWLWELHCQQAGGILGDEMGLGKTIQIVVFLASLHYSQIIDKAPPRYKGLGPTIVVTPVTVMQQWVKEFQKWYPPLRVAILHASGSSNNSANNLLYSVVSVCGVIITSYSTFLNHQKLISKHRWNYVILDEGHKIRNPEALVTIAVKRVDTVHRLILSGSPIQNNLKELWSLYDFVFPGKLGTLNDFMEHFAYPITQGGYSNATQVQVLTAYKCATVLRNTISPYLIRRMKSDVNSTQLKLPAKSEQVLFCRLTSCQRTVYQEYLTCHEVQNILSGKLLIFPGLIKMRKICNHPDLTTGELRMNYVKNPKSGEETFGHYSRSGKMIVLKTLLELWSKQKRKVLLFTQGTQTLNVLELFIQDLNYTYIRMDGTTVVGQRQKLVNRFNEEKSLFVFLLTTRVGGLGVNLTGASRVIIFDPDWNPSVDTQARERAWRIGQRKDVIIYRLVTTGTVEEKIYQRQIFKQFLTNKILTNPKQRRFFRSGDLKDLFSLADENVFEESETHALLSGTNSVVDLKSVKKPVKPSKQKHQNDSTEVSDKERLRELAKSISLRLESDLKSKKLDNGNSSPQITEGLPLSDELNEIKEPTEGEDKPENTECETERDEQSRILREETKNILGSELFTNMGDLEFESKLDQFASQSQSQDLIMVVNSRDDCMENGTENGIENGTDESEQRKNQLAATTSGEKCEGLVIPGLQKVRKLKREYREAKPARNPVDEEEYILSKLLKKSFLHGALQHDTVVNSCNADYMIVEAEAQKVANQAAEFLKKSAGKSREFYVKTQLSEKPKKLKKSLNGSTSRTKSSHNGTSSVHQTDSPHISTSRKLISSRISSCEQTNSPQPSTSNHNISKPSTSRLTDSPQSSRDSVNGHSASKKRKLKKKTSQDDEEIEGEKIVKKYQKMFNGHKLVDIIPTTRQSDELEAPLTSAELLSLIRQRNGTEAETGQIQAGTNIGEQIRSYMLNPDHPTHHTGFTASSDLIQTFSNITVTALEFRSILRTLCDFKKLGGVGYWRLKPEYV